MVTGDAIDDVVDGFTPPTDVNDFLPDGILAGGVGNISIAGIMVRGNRVQNLIPKGSGEARGITIAAYGTSVRDNFIGSLSVTGKGIYCSFGGIASGNHIYGFSTGVAFRADDGHNVAL